MATTAEDIRRIRAMAAGEPVSLAASEASPDVRAGEAEALGAAAPRNGESAAEIAARIRNLARQSAAGVVGGIGWTGALLLDLMEARRETTPAHREAGAGSALGDLTRRGIDTAVSTIAGEEPRTGGERAARLVGEELGASALPAGAALKRGRTLLKAGKKATTPLLGRLLEQAGRKPGAFIAEEAAGAAGAGIGRARGQEVAPGSVWSETWRGLVGGVTPSAAWFAARSVYRASRFFKETALRRIAPRVSEDRAAELLQTNTGSVERALEELDRVDALRAEFPGFEPSLGAATNDPGLRALEAELISTDPATALRLQDARSSGDAALRGAMVAASPPATDVELAQAAVRSYLRRRLEELEQRVAEVGGKQDPAKIAELRRVELDGMARQFRDEMAAGFDELQELADARKAVFSPAPMSAAARRAERKAGELGRKHLPQDLIDQYKDLPEFMPFSELRNARRTINEEIRQARQAGNRPLEMYLEILRDGVQDALDTVGAVGIKNPTPQQRRAIQALEKAGHPLYADIAARYRRLEAGFREGAEMFRGGQTGEILRPRRVPTPASGTLGFYFKSGKGAKEAASEFKTVFAEVPEAQQGMLDYIVSTAYEAAADEHGVVNQRALRTFVNRTYSEALEEFPEARERLRSVAMLSEDVERLGIKAPRSREAVSRGALSLFVEDPQGAIRAILKSSDPARGMAELRRRVGGNPDALNGVQRAFWDEMIDRVVRTNPDEIGQGFVTPNQMARFLEDYAAPMRVLFNDADIAGFHRMAQAANINARIPVPGAARVPTPEESYWSQIAVKGGVFTRILSPKLRAARVIRFTRMWMNRLTDQDAMRLAREALVDPELRRRLLLKPTAANDRTLIRFITTNMPTLPIRVERASEAEDNRTALP